MTLPNGKGGVEPTARGRTPSANRRGTGRASGPTTPPDPAQAAARLRKAGFAVCKIRPGQKRPTYPKWSTRTIDAADVGPEDNLGIVCGPLSAPPGHALVGVDLDSRKAVRLADDYLPDTAMVDGRAGKPRSHRWYLVRLAGINAEHHSHAAQTAPVMIADHGHPGPRTISFRDADGREIVRLIGTGGQAVVPPSVHESGERRAWAGGRRGEPAVVTFGRLLKAVCRLARECGWTPKPDPVPAPADGGDPADQDHSTLDPFLTYRINRYVDELPPSVSEAGGHDACYRAACVLVWGFGLSEADALKFLRRFNTRCRPGWSGRDLLHKLRDAATATDHQKVRGHLL